MLVKHNNNNKHGYKPNKKWGKRGCGSGISTLKMFMPLYPMYHLFKAVATQWADKVFSQSAQLCYFSLFY